MIWPVLANAGVPQIVVDTITGHKPHGSVTAEVYTEAEQWAIDKAREVVQAAWVGATTQHRRLRAV